VILTASLVIGSSPPRLGLSTVHDGAKQTVYQPRVVAHEELPTSACLTLRNLISVLSGLRCDSQLHEGPMNRMGFVTTISTLVFAAFVAMALPPLALAEDAADPSHFTYARLYCTPDGESHFQNVTVELRQMNFAPPASPINIGGNSTAASAFFAGFDQHWGTEDLQKRLNHPTPAVQFLTVLRGVFSITATDGETRQFHAGEVLRLEDTAPCKGHITVVGDQPGFLLFAR
jgi:hypothetical protein